MLLDQPKSNLAHYLLNPPQAFRNGGPLGLGEGKTHMMGGVVNRDQVGGGQFRTQNSFSSDSGSLQAQNLSVDNLRREEDVKRISCDSDDRFNDIYDFENGTQAKLRGTVVHV